MTTVAELRRMADVQEHYERGGAVQSRSRYEHEWRTPDGWGTCNGPVWNWQHVEYRIAPEPRKARECWRWEDLKGRLWGCYESEDECRRYEDGINGRPVRFVEAMDEPAREER